MSEIISVIIPTYNREKLVIEAIESAIKQTYRPLEIVIIDDGSTDNTCFQVNKFISRNDIPDCYFKYITQSNKGGNAARNTGIKVSQGEYLAFLDSDDLWLPEKLEIQMKLINTKPDVGAIYCGVKEYDSVLKKVTSNEKRKFIQGSIHKELLIKDVSAPTSTFMVKKKVFDYSGLFDESLKARQDWDMWIRISEKYDIHAAEKNLTILRLHRGKRTASNPLNEIESYKIIRNKYQNKLKNLNFFKRREAKANYLKRLGRIYHHNKISNVKAFKNLSMSILMCPYDFDNWAAFVGFFLPKKTRKLVHISWNNYFSETNFKIRSH